MVRSTCNNVVANFSNYGLKVVFTGDAWPACSAVWLAIVKRLAAEKKAKLNWLEILKWLALSIHVENYASRVEHYQKIDNSCFVVSTRRRWLHAYVLGPRDYKALPLPLSHRITATAPLLHTSHRQAAAKRVTSSPRPSHRYLRPNDRCVIEGNHFLLLCTALPSQLLCLNEMVTYRQSGNQVDIH